MAETQGDDGNRVTRIRRFDAFAVAAPGLERLAAAELQAIGAQPLESVVGGVPFAAEPAVLFRSNLELRTVTRVLVRLATFRATTFRDLERLARGVAWEEFLAPGAGAELRVTCRKSRLYHSDAVAQRVQEAIARRVRDVSVTRLSRAGEADDGDDGDAADDAGDSVTGRAEGDAAKHGGALAKEFPLQLFVVRFDHDECQISADASGALLHRRGYRLATAKAPLRETLAAAALLAAGYDGSAPVLDPMCGAGTIAIEAALIARRMAPGLQRHFACERWPSAPSAVFAALRDDARAGVLGRAPAPIVASDRDAGAIEACRANAARAGVTDDIDIRCCALSAATVPHGTGLLLTNPPYGTRVGEGVALRNLYAQLGNLARRRLGGWSVALLSAHRELERQTGLPLEAILRFRNGGLPVRLVRAMVPPPVGRL